ncbi:MAG TPA: hypothetical protein VHT52_03165 [Stellaceae bacterium]|jgi:hypothetical protein|nr:hypothetical protein [Stellaceae bacterium]
MSRKIGKPHLSGTLKGRLRHSPSTGEGGVRNRGPDVRRGAHQQILVACRLAFIVQKIAHAVAIDETWPILTGIMSIGVCEIPITNTILVVTVN